MWGRCCTRSELLKQIQIGCWIVVQMFDRSSLSTKLSLHTFGRLTPEVTGGISKMQPILQDQKCGLSNNSPFQNHGLYMIRKMFWISVSEATSPSTCLGDDIPWASSPRKIHQKWGVFLPTSEISKSLVSSDCLITGESQDGFCNCGLPHGEIYLQVEVLVDGILPPTTMDVFGRWPVWQAY